MRTALAKLIPDIHRALQEEIAAARQRGGDSVWISGGTFLGPSQNGWLYEFRLESEAFFPDECGVEVEIQGHRTSGAVVTCEEFNVVLDLDDQLTGDLRSGRLVIKLWYILERLDIRLRELAQVQVAPTSSDLVHLLRSGGDEGGGPLPFRKFPGLNPEQAEAVSRSRVDPVLFLWGPPGTGKTRTVARIVEQHFRAGNRTLVLAYSNAALDEAMLRVAELIPGPADQMAGRVLRIGTPRKDEVRDHPWLSSRAALRQRFPDLIAEYERLRDQLTLLRDGGSRAALDRARDELRSLREEIKRLERAMATEAQVLGCTLAKLAVDEGIAQPRPEVVVLDEGSMASVPFALLAAAVAQRSLAVAGDFMQLPPVVLSDGVLAQKWLKQHVFDLAGVPAAVRGGRHPQRVVQLLEQYRMHPEIRASVSEVFYEGRLRDAADIEEKTRPVAALPPAVNHAVLVIDTSRLSARCPREPDQLGTSRFNVAHFALALALLSEASQHDGYESIAFICPFRAQAKLVRLAIDDLGWRGRVQASTVHRFQGGEASLVIFDLCTAAGHDSLGPLLRGDIWSDAGKLLNVAISRAEGKLIVLAEMTHLNRLIRDADAVFKVLVSLSHTGVGGPVDLDWVRRRLAAGAASDRVALQAVSFMAPGAVNSDGVAARSEILLNVAPGTQPPAWLRGAASRGVRVTVTGSQLPRAWRSMPHTRLNDSPRPESAMLVDRDVLWLDNGNWSFRLALPATAAYLADLLMVIPPAVRGANLPGSTAFQQSGIRPCPKCRGAMWLESGHWGPRLRCTECGHSQNPDKAAVLAYLHACGTACEDCKGPADAVKTYSGWLVQCASGCGWRCDLVDLV